MFSHVAHYLSVWVPAPCFFLPCWLATPCTSDPFSEFLSLPVSSTFLSCLCYWPFSSLLNQLEGVGAFTKYDAAIRITKQSLACTQLSVGTEISMWRYKENLYTVHKKITPAIIVFTWLCCLLDDSVVCFSGVVFLSVTYIMMSLCFIFCKLSFKLLFTS